MIQYLTKSWQSVRIVLLGGLIIIGTLQIAQADSATAIAQNEIMVLGKALEQQQAEEQITPETPRPIQASRSHVNAVSGDEQSVITLPALNMPVIDPMQLLSTQDQAQLSQKILEIYQSGKAQIGIVIVPTTGQQDIFTYSLAIAEQWGLGAEKYDNGLLIIVALNDRKIQILTGYGLEGVLPDIVVSRIIRNQITPKFQNNQYTQGLLAGLNEINQILSLDPEIARQAAEQLRIQQEEAHQKAVANQASFGRAFMILMIAVFASALVGRKLAGIGAGIAGVISGLIAGSGIVMSLVIGLVLFMLIISQIAQSVAHVAMSSRGGGGGSSRRGGGGFSGGGGGFGGGGASGSW